MNSPSVAPELKALLASGRRGQLPSGQVMNSLGENLGLVIVESGYIKRYLITGEGDQSIQSIYGPGDIFPLTPVFKALLNLELSDSQEILYYEAITKTWIRSVTMGALQDYAQHNQSIYKDLFYVAGIRLSSNIQRLDNMSLGSSYRRLAHQLAYFANHFGQLSDKGIKILVPLTHQDLASVLNVSRETISRSLSRLQQKGLVESGKNITILDIENLRREIY